MRPSKRRPPPIVGGLWGRVGDLAVGWACRPREIENRAVISIEYDKTFFCTTVAQNFDPDLLAKGIGDGCHAFAVHMPQWMLRFAHQVRARVANTEQYLDGVIDLAALRSAKRLPALPKDAPATVRYLQASVHYDGFLRLSGWAFDPNAPKQTISITVEVDGKPEDTILANQFREDLQENAIGDGCHGFVYWLCARFADARLHRVRLLDERGRQLHGSPVEVFALPAGARRLVFDIRERFKRKAALDEETRAELALLESAASEIDRVNPPQFSQKNYRHWYQLFGVPSKAQQQGAEAALKTVFGINAQSQILTPDRQGLRSPPKGVLIADPCESLAQIYSRMLMGGAKLLVLKRKADLLLPHALAMLAQSIVSHRTDAAYGHLDYLQGAAKTPADPSDRPEFFHRQTEPVTEPLWRKPERFDLYRQLCQDYVTDGLMIRRGAIDALMAAGEISSSAMHTLRGYDLGYLIAEPALCPFVTVRRQTAAEPTHGEIACAAQSAQRFLDRTFPGRRICVHTQPKNPSLRAIDYRNFASDVALVSLVIPMRDAAQMTRRAIESCLRLAGKNLPIELILVNNQSVTDSAKALLKEVLSWPNPSAKRLPEKKADTCARLIRTQVLHVDRPFNYAAMMNLAARKARGEVLAFVNNDIEALTGHWLAHMVGCLMQKNSTSAQKTKGPRRSQSYRVGAVGAKLLYPSGRIQHAGVHITADAMPEHTGLGQDPDAPGPHSELQVDRRVDAVTAACLVLRRADYFAAGAMDEKRLPIAFNDVDLCLKLAGLGLDTVVMGQVLMLHRESETRARAAQTPAQQTRQALEVATIRGAIGRHLQSRAPVNQPSDPKTRREGETLEN